MTQNYFKYFNSTKKSTPIPETVCNQAIKKMFPSLKDERKREKLIQFISSQYKELNCCVLYRISADFNELCRRLGLDPGDQEVIIREDFSIAYSKNFFIPPHNISWVRLKKQEMGANCYFSLLLPPFYIFTFSQLTYQI